MSGVWIGARIGAGVGSRLISAGVFAGLSSAMYAWMFGSGIVYWVDTALFGMLGALLGGTIGLLVARLSRRKRSPSPDSGLDSGSAESGA